ncbi:MAG: hypothetical protein Q9187_003631 [Circinaria calcarea]
MAQVKKGLKSLFSRKKKDKHQSTQPASVPSSAPAAASQAAPQLAPISQDPPIAAGSQHPPETHVPGADPVKQTMPEEQAIPALQASESSANPSAPHTSIPQISEPNTVSESKNIDLNPVSSTPKAAETSANIVTDAPQDTAKEISKLDTKLDTKLPAEGMSATSGPLRDDLVTGFGGSPVEGHMRAAHAEKRAQMAESGNGGAMSTGEGSKV